MGLQARWTSVGNAFRPRVCGAVAGTDFGKDRCSGERVSESDSPQSTADLSKPSNAAKGQAVKTSFDHPWIVVTTRPSLSCAARYSI